MTAPDERADLAEDTSVQGDVRQRTAFTAGTTSRRDGDVATHVRDTHRWRGVVAVAIVAGVVGVVSNRPDVLLLGALGTVFAAYPWMFSAPEPSVTVDRRVDESTPLPGSTVEVTVTVRNDGDRPLYDLRIVDGVPPGLGVVAGTPRLGTALRPGDSDAFSYSVEATVGCHRFDPTTVIARDPSGARAVETTGAPDTEIRCRPSTSAPPLRPEALRHFGQFVSGTSGSGLEFHSLREYVPGDPARRISWSHLARTGSPATVDFLREQRTTVTLVVDAREPSYRGRADGPHAVQTSVEAADAIASPLLRTGNPVGIGTVGRCVSWLPPSTGKRHRIDVRRILTTDPALAPTPCETECDVEAQFNELRSLLPGTAQVLLLSPLLDDRIATFVEKLHSVGVPVSVLSPDVTADATAGQRLATVERQNRIRRIRRGGVPVLDWDTDESLAKTLVKRRGVAP